MKVIVSALSLLLCLTVQTVQVQAKKNVVFVHGLAGFGPDELFGLGYWGRGNIFKQFPADEWNVFEAEVGAVSSNWDRACELYAQIVGGKVDYGEAHSTEHGHLRTTFRDYPGFVPDWSAENPVHLVGHSMGSQTIRLLEILMQEGDAKEREVSGDSVSDLFRGGHAGWVRSITNVSGPLDGSTLTLVFGDKLVDLIRQLIIFFASLGGLDGEDQEFLYDFGLDQWGLEKLEGEKNKDYFDRVFNSNFFTQDGFKDLANHDVGLEGAAELNMRGEQSYPNTYYFSFVTENMHRGLWPLAHRNYYHDLDMIPLLWPFADAMGRYGGNWGPWTSWHENDGLVPTISQECPKLGYSDDYANCANDMPRNIDDLAPGKWYTQRFDMDHMQIVGFSLIKDPLPIYKKHAQVLASIHDRPGAISSRLVEGGEISVPVAGAIGSVGLAAGAIAGAGVALVVSKNRRNKEDAEIPQELAGLPEDVAVARWASFSSTRKSRGSTVIADNPTFDV